MIHNYLKIALRTFLKNRIFTAITLSGLSLGICCFILLFLYVRHELTFDHFHAKKDSLYRLLIRQELPESSSTGKQYGVFFDPKLLEIFRVNNPSVLHATRYQSGRNWVKYDTKMNLNEIGYVDSDFLKMFSFPLLAGDADTALENPNGIILTTDLVDFFFGEQNGDYSRVIGKVVSVPASERKDFVVTGIMKNIPDNSVFRFSALIPYSLDETWQSIGSCNDIYGSSHIFMEVDSPENVAALENNMGATLMSFYRQKIEFERLQGRLSKSDHCLGAYLQPLSNVYFDAHEQYTYLRNGNICYSIILTGIASLILIIACINAVTIQLGQATVRSREVGIRKVIGAKQSQLVTQFFIEAGVLCAVSVALAIILTELLLPTFSHLAQKQLELSLVGSAPTALFLLISMVLITLIIGGFPSLIMSRFPPLIVLKFQKLPRGRSLFTNGLVVVQYAITIILFFATFVMHRQIRYIHGKNTGFEREGVMVLSLPTEMSDDRRESIKNRLESLPSVLNVGGSNRNFEWGRSSDSVETPYGDHVAVRIMNIDEGYLGTLGIRLMDGEGYSADMTADRNRKILINQTMTEQFQWNHPVGQTVRFWGQERQVIGVVEDFHIDSMREKLPPLILRWSSPSYMRYYFIRYRAGQVAECRTAIEKIWNEYEPNRAIELRFLDSILQEQYEDEERWNCITIYASTIAIILSCMGLWGITALAVTRRTKEIGIRKVLGSGEAGIWKLFSTDLLRLFAFSFVIAVPFAWYAMQKWLDLFAYHIGLPWQAFAQAALICLFLSMVTISWLVLRAAGNNPVESLRYE